MIGRLGQCIPTWNAISQYLVKQTEFWTSLGSCDTVTLKSHNGPLSSNESYLHIL